MKETYYASATGRLKLAEADEETELKTADLIRTGIAEHVFIEAEDDRSAVITFEGSSLPYREECLRELFSALEGHCEEGDIEFCGEDRRLWCIHFSGVRGEWVRLRGRVVYEKE